MAKSRKVYVCANCGREYGKWMGKCPECGAWDSLEEEIRRKKETAPPLTPKGEIHKILEIPVSAEGYRHVSGISEFDRVVGGGIFSKSIVLLSGGPGIGKSTMMLQVSEALSRKGTGVLYVSAEESGYQIRARGERLDVRSDIFISGETELSSIISMMEDQQYKLFIIDSIQTVYDSGLESAPGTMSQIRNTLTRLRESAMRLDKAVVVIGHINKSGEIAGPMFLEHMVDAVLLFEGDSKSQWRILRCKKNRYGSTDEIGVFVMSGQGLIEVEEPANYFINKEPFLSGASVGSLVEGLRPIFFEVQALATKSVFSMPQRVANGFDLKRMNILLAVLEKRLNFNIGNHDIFLNIAGGLRISDTSADAAVVMAVVSSLRDRELGNDTLFIGEVGLSGEIRNVPMLQKRVEEALKMGYRRISIPETDVSGK